MKTTFLGLTLVVLLLSGSYATKGVDVYTAVSTAAWKCIAPGFAIIRGYCSNGTVDPKAKQTIANAHSAGVPYVDVYHCPCTSQSATSQANSLLSKISASSFGTLWIDVETNPSSGCGWGSPSASCTFL
jgi:GH25 family lysozyme M1 (1,4-beta-N-acetylmuramidase)